MPVSVLLATDGGKPTPEERAVAFLVRGAAAVSRTSASRATTTATRRERGDWHERELTVPAEALTTRFAGSKSRAVGTTTEGDENLSATSSVEAHGSLRAALQQSEPVISEFERAGRLEAARPS